MAEAGRGSFGHAQAAPTDAAALCRFAVEAHEKRLRQCAIGRMTWCVGSRKSVHPH